MRMWRFERPRLIWGLVWFAGAFRSDLERVLLVLVP